jgi:hypothetical protein
VANVVHNLFHFRELGGGAQIDLDADTIKVSLHTSAHTPAKTQSFFSDLTNEIAVAGYTAGGQALAGKALSSSGDRTIFDANDTSWTANITGARYAVVYKDTGVAGTSVLICTIDFGQDVSHVGGIFTIVWHADGILYARQAA